MSLQTVARQLVDLCNQGENFDVMRTMYHDDIVSVEPDGQETAGKAAVIEKSERWAEANTIHGETVLGPFFQGTDQFATQSTWEVTRKDTGERTTLKEITVYTVKNDLITREAFYFDGERW